MRQRLFFKLALVVEAAWLGWFFYRTSDGATGLEETFFALVASAGVIVIGLSWLVSTIDEFRHWRRVLRFHLLQNPRWLAEPSVILLSFVMLTTPYPFALRMWASEKAVLSYVQDVQSGRVTVPNCAARWVGLFYVRCTETVGTAVSMTTGDCGVLGQCGFAYSNLNPVDHAHIDAATRAYGEWWTWYDDL